VSGLHRRRPSYTWRSWPAKHYRPISRENVKRRECMLTWNYPGSCRHLHLVWGSYCNFYILKFIVIMMFVIIITMIVTRIKEPECGKGQKRRIERDTSHITAYAPPIYEMLDKMPGCHFYFAPPCNQSWHVLNITLRRPSFNLSINQFILSKKYHPFITHFALHQSECTPHASKHTPSQTHRERERHTQTDTDRQTDRSSYLQSAFPEANN